MEKAALTRRQFLKGVAATGVSAWLVGQGNLGKGLIAMAASDDSLVDEILRGSIDAHMHMAPDIIARKMTDIQLGEEATKVGLRGVVLKSHHSMTSDRAYLIRQLYPNLEAYGGIVLNRVWGGLNPRAVEISMRMSGKYGKWVWMPTQDSENDEAKNKRGVKPVPVYIDGKPAPGLVDVLKTIAENQLILATGHVSAAESVRLVEDARSLGVERIVVTHASNEELIGMSIADQVKVAKMGAYIEHCYLQVHKYVSGQTGGTPMSEIIDMIKAVGPARVVLSTDFGQTTNPTPVEGMRALIRELLKAGFSKAEILQMTYENVSRLHA